jgi:hypothetical protein
MRQTSGYFFNVSCRWLKSITFIGDNPPIFPLYKTKTDNNLLVGVKVISVFGCVY